MPGIMSGAKRLLTGLAGGPNGKLKSQRRKARLKLERLESRRVFSAEPTFAILDFDGDDLTSAEMAEGGWSSSGAQSVPSFVSLFNSRRPFLDMNADATVDAKDAQLAISAIFNKVKEDFAPYALTVKLGDQDAHQHLLTSGAVGDVIVMITGGGDFLSGTSAFGVQSGSIGDGGDAGNAHDEIVWAFGREIAKSSTRASDFINKVAFTISHEMGHAFGLKHVPIMPGNEPMTHLIMGADDPSGGRRDFKSDFNFQDISYAVEGGGTQNTHQLLTRTLGASKNPWVAVLKPGELTIQGSEAKDQIRVVQLQGFEWRVSVNTLSRLVNIQDDQRRDEGRLALSPFSAQVTTIFINALGGDDTILIGGGKHNIAVTVATVIDAGAGNDYVQGGSGRDTIRGGIGDDTIYGLAGDDFLYGQAGLDRIFGGLGNDWLDGGADYLADILRGEQGNDTFVRYARLNGLFYSYELENTDFNVSGIDRFTTTTIRPVTRR